MSTAFKLSIVSVFLFFSKSWATDVTLPVKLPMLQEEPQQLTVSERVTQRYTQAHYRKFSLDAQFASNIFDRYLNMIDYNHNILLASDIDQFKSTRAQLGALLTNGKLDELFNLFNLSQQRRLQRYQYALSVVALPMSFTANKIINLDRSKAPWPQTEVELNMLWDQRVQYDELNLKLSGKSETEIRETLTRRYKTAIRRMLQINSEDVFQTIMNSFSHEIDPHTNYLSPRNAEQFNTEMSLSLEGIGATLQSEDDYTLINSMVPGGPAARSNLLKVGDKILAVGQTNQPMVDVVGMRLDDLVEKIKGPKGSKVKLEIQSAAKNAKPHVITITRDKIRLEDRAVKTTLHTLKGHKIAVLDIPSFYVGLTNDTKAQLQKLEKQKVESVIIDLRSNGGGALSEAVSLSGLFIPSGPIVQVRDNSNNIHQDSDEDGIVYYKGPLVILVDRFSASASEIFAAAMQDYGRALIVGEPTFGKGTVQQYRSLNRIYDQMLRPDWPAMGSVQYTIQKFYRINGGSTQLKGVTPDIIMPTGAETIKSGEKYQDNALPWDSIKPANYKPVSNIAPLLPLLKQQHEKRIATNQEFQYILDDVKRYNAMQNTIDQVSLNYHVREEENKRDEKTRLMRINHRLVAEGKPQIKSIDALPNNYKDPDPYLDETLLIAEDLSKVQHKKS